MPSYPRFDANEHQDMADYLRSLAENLRHRGELVDQRFPQNGPDSLVRRRWEELESAVHGARAALHDVWQRDAANRGSGYL